MLEFIKKHAIMFVRVLKGGIIMAKKGENRELVTLSCTVCKEKNYRTPKNKKNTTDRLELNKYCPKCQKHTAHKEDK